MTQSELIQAINETITPNGNKAITAESLAILLKEIVTIKGDSAGVGAPTIFMGKINPILYENPEEFISLPFEDWLYLTDEQLECNKRAFTMLSGLESPTPSVDITGLLESLVDFFKFLLTVESDPELMELINMFLPDLRGTIKIALTSPGTFYLGREFFTRILDKIQEILDMLLEAEGASPGEITVEMYFDMLMEELAAESPELAGAIQNIIDLFGQGSVSVGASLLPLMLFPTGKVLIPIFLLLILLI